MEKHANARDESLPGVTLSSFVEVLTAPGSEPILRGNTTGTEPRIMGREEESPERKTKGSSNGEDSTKTFEEKSIKIFFPQRH